MCVQNKMLFSTNLLLSKHGTTMNHQLYICDRLQENRAQRGVRKYREKIDRFLKNVLFQADGRERLGLL